MLVVRSLVNALLPTTFALTRQLLGAVLAIDVELAWSSADLVLWARQSLRYVAAHTGVPATLIVLCVILALVRVFFRQIKRLLVSVVLVLALVFLAIKAGLISW
jgi:hypothetical protein